MTLGLYAAERRRRSRIRASAIKIALGIVCIGVIAAFSYQIGIEQLKNRDASLRDELTEANRRHDEIEKVALQWQAVAQASDAKLKDLAARYNQDVPQGDVVRLSRLISEKLTAGVTVDRLAFVISQAQNARNCQATETKRFVLSTPIYKGANASAGFANGAITVTGEGISARNAAGNQEGWFDPAAPVTLHFLPVGGKETVVTGKLPMQKSIVAGATEHRFVITAGQRSFVEVAADHCPYP
ncbi:MAG: hypothetical protein P4M00_06655 [Azospirillaceae bacterium]|nr:hypothetical protein [Azospirillaceae bacterium]